LFCSWLRRLFSELEALGMPWRTAEDGVWGHGSRTEGMVFVHQVKSDVYRGRGGALARETSPAAGNGPRSSGRPALTINTADLQRESGGALELATFQKLPTQQHDRGSIIIRYSVRTDITSCPVVNTRSSFALLSSSVVDHSEASPALVIANAS
jgi:hypothetical protein